MTSLDHKFDFATAEVGTLDRLGLLGIEPGNSDVGAVPLDRSFELPGGVFRLMFACYAGFVGLMFLAFGAGAGMGLTLAICAFYGAMYFGVPVVFTSLSQTTARSLDWQALRTRGLMTASGHHEIGDVLGQVLLVPVAILVLGAAIAFITMFTI